MKKLFCIILTVSLMINTNAFSGSEGSEELSKSSGTTTSDCFEGVSRAFFSFNQGLDRAVFEPLAKGYRKLPKPIRKGTGNMVNNLSNLVTIPNNLLQGQLQQAGLNTLRFTLNTTIGILGFFDPANRLGLQAVGKEDYGQTLGAWGSHSGCYFVLPVLGPTTVRDFTGTVINFVGGDPWYNVTVRQDTNFFRDRDFYISRTTNSVDFRAKNIESFDSLERNSIDFYASVKSLYLQDRKMKVGNSDAITETQDDSDWEEINNN